MAIQTIADTAPSWTVTNRRVRSHDFEEHPQKKMALMPLVFSLLLSGGCQIAFRP